MPLGTDASLSALAAMLLYARVVTGDIMALFLAETPLAADSASHAIDGAPAWLPRASTQMAYLEALHDPLLDWPSLEKLEETVEAAIEAKVPYYRIVDVQAAIPANVENSMQQVTEGCEGEGKERDQEVWPGGHPHMEIQEGNIILGIQVLLLLTVNLYLKARGTGGEASGLEMLREGVERGSTVVACIQSSKHIQYWLILIRKGEASGCWAILGHLETGHIRDGAGYCSINGPPSYRFVIE